MQLLRRNYNNIYLVYMETLQEKVAKAHMLRLAHNRDINGLEALNNTIEVLGIPNKNEIKEMIDGRIDLIRRVNNNTVAEILPPIIPPPPKTTKRKTFK